MALLFSNNASAELAAALTADATTLYVEEGKGSYFPVISRVGDYFYVTLVGDSVMEIVKVTATEGDTFTIVRAQDNTEAAAFAIGDLIELRITAADFKDILTSPKLSDFFADSSKVNPIYSTDADTYQYWSGIRGGVYYYNRAGSLVNQPSQYGLLLHCAQLAFVFQLWKSLPNGDLYYRSMSDTNERDEWTKVAKDADLTALAEQINTDITTSINNLDTKIDTVNTNATTGINDLSTQVDATYLKKSGGTMTGTISIGPYGGIYEAKESANAGVAFNADESGVRGASFTARSAATGGAFACGARNATYAKYLMGYPEGALTWINKNIVRSVNGVDADANGNVALGKSVYLTASWNSGTNWYRKYSDGWIEQGGTTQNVGSDSTVTVSCHTPFTTTNYNIVVSQKSNGTKTDSTGMVLVYPSDTSSWYLHNGDNVSAPFMWYACGF